MKRKKRREITVETDEVLIIRRSRSLVSFRCLQCAGQMVGLHEAMTFAGFTSRAIHQWVEAGKIHFIERKDGILLFCLVSLAKLASMSIDVDERE